MTEKEQKKSAAVFAGKWEGRGYEKGESQTFWLTFLHDVYGVEHPDEFITFEEQVHLDHTSFIDGYINTTKVMIEQKGLGKDLNKPIKQSDGSMLTPFQQAKRYITELPVSMHPRWVVTCNFSEFYVYDMERPTGEPEIIKLCDLPKEYYRLNFLVDMGNENIKQEMEISLQAGELVGKLYNALLKQYKNPESEQSLKSLNMLCVRLVFCLYAEDAQIFGKHLMFHDYLKRFEPRDIRRSLIDLFKVLDTKDEDRDPYLDDELKAFPYVNGGLFADEHIEIPTFNEEIVNLLLHNASEDFNWSQISPTIFGAVFESTLNPETRRSGGMHYTSIENIHKVIDPLFLDDLKSELEEIKQLKQPKAIAERVEQFQKKLGSLKFLDPACGSGNFLTETYISLRRLENEALKFRNQGQMVLDMKGIIKVSIGQFYGIEINDFAVTVAKTALWIAESQMLHETEEIMNIHIDFLPLKSYANIVEGNSLRVDWESVVPKAELNYIMGNPPFIGASMMTSEQKQQAVDIYGKIKLSNSIDYVGAWYYKSAFLIKGTNIKCAFVSTNSITQGEQVAPLWKTLIEKYGINIDFGYRTFKWSSEASEKAAVHCVIIGFSSVGSNNKRIFYSNNRVINAQNINPYLVDAPTVFVESRANPISDVPKMYLGNKPADGGNLILTVEEKDSILKKEPQLEKYVRKYVGAYEYINNKERYCFWLTDLNPVDVKKNSELYNRLAAVKEMRENSTAAPTRQKANTPHLFFFISQPTTNYLLVPSTSSENRKYIPIGFMPPDIIASNLVMVVPNANLYHFGVMTSNVHMAWVRTVAGRLKSDYRYTGNVVYNTFPWCNPTNDQMAKIEMTAQDILDARANYPDCSLADLYDDVKMPSDLRTAHQNNDRAVMNAYGFSVKDMTESGCVAELMKMYREMTEKK